MLDLLNILFALWLGVGLLYFIVAMASFIAGKILAMFGRRRPSAFDLLILPFYILWMLPIILAIYLFAGIWWLWDTLFKREARR
jgi:hypothetical protein